MRARSDYDAALAHFAAMLPCPRSPAHWQAHYLRQFLDAVAQAAATKVRPLLFNIALSCCCPPAPLWHLSVCMRAHVSLWR
jgi:hypothetical protein